jgi:hypothetical protein
MTIAVTGHRDVWIDDRLREQINSFFIQMSETHKRITLLNALADGADQLVASCALKYQNINLEVPLPMEKKTYLATLTHKESFLALLDESKTSYVISKQCEHLYENLGHYLVDNSDVLVALWDGSFNGKQGGTGDVVSYAKSKNHTLIHLLVTRKNN